MKNIYKQYLFVAKFLDLKNKWKRETGFMSSIADIHTHPAYKRIIDMGEEVIPFILNDLRVNGGHWFGALQAITGENPMNINNNKKWKGKMKVMSDAWIKWGMEKGYCD